MKTVHIQGIKAELLGKTAKRKTGLKSASVVGGIAAKAIKNDLLPAINIEQRDTASLKPAAKRVRKSKPSLVTALAASMAAHGFIVPVLVRGDEIIDGHSRVEAAKKLGLPQVLAIDLAHLSPDECQLVMVALNRTAELGEWDVEMLREVMIDIDASDFDLTLTGFTMAEIDIIKLDPEPEASSELNTLPEEAAVVTSRPGDLWQLGNHRLLCGSALEPASYDELLGGEKAAMVLTDPPYNVKIAGNVSGLGKTKHGEFVEATGEMSDDEFRIWLSDFSKCVSAVTQHAGVAMMFMDWRHVSDLTRAGMSAGLQLINMVVWDKQRGGMGGLYRSAHELVAIFCNGAPSPVINNVKLGAHGRDRSNMWSYPGATTPGSSAAKALHLHPTPKPVGLLVDAMLDVSNLGDLVLDPFMGSGSTIIAGEECGRHVRGCELDPKYVDCAVRRWEIATGKEAVLMSIGQSFAAVADERAAVAGDGTLAA